MESGLEGSDCSLSWPGVLIKERKDGRSCWPQKPNSRVKCQPGVCLSARAEEEGGQYDSVKCDLVSPPLD